MDDGRCFLLDAERVIKLRGNKPYPSKKVRLLHNIFLYNQIFELSTSISSTVEPPFQTVGRSQIQSEMTTSMNIMPDLTLQGVNPVSSSGNDGNLCDQLIMSDGSWFESIYGFPIELMKLILHVTYLAQETDSQQTPGFHTMTSLTNRARVLEDLICGFKWRPNSNKLLQAEGTTRQDDLMRPLVSAIHQALLIFFYRRIRKLNSYALQPFVKRTVSELFEFQHMKKENNIVTPVPCWPGFIAGCEALEEEDRQRFRDWYSQSGGGWRSFDTIGGVVEQFWRAKATNGELTWDCFLQQRRIVIIPT